MTVFSGAFSTSTNPTANRGIRGDDSLFLREESALRVFRSVYLPVLFLLLSAASSRALDPSVHISQYGHIAWRIQDGFFTGAPTSIAQTADGYLWVGTADGLFRFDGTRFVPSSDISHQQTLASAEVSALLGARDGSLWIGAGYRFFRWKDNRLSQYSGDEDQFVESIVETNRGSVWLARDRYTDGKGPLCEVKDLGLRCYGRSEGVPFINAFSVTEDRSGNLWIGSDAQLLRWQSGRSTSWEFKRLRKTEGLDGVVALVIDRNDCVWAGSNYPGLGLEQFQNGYWKPYLSPQLKGSNIEVSRLYQDRNGSLWVGTEGDGIYRISAGKADHFDAANGLSGDKITAIFQDHEGTVWVGTSNGIDSFRDLPIVTLSSRDGLHLDDARSIVASSDGTIWIGNDGSLDALRNGAITSILPKDGLPGRVVTSILEDPSGGLWVGLDSSLFYLTDRKFVPVINRSAPNIVLSMTRGADGTLWAELGGATNNTLVRIQNGHVIAEKASPPGEAVMALAADHDGRLWLAGDKLHYLDNSGETTLTDFGPRYGYLRNIAVDSANFVWFGATKGLVGFRDGKMQVMTTKNGLPCERINTLVLDDHGFLWLYAQCGLIRIEHSELEKWWNNPGIRVISTVFDSMDGFHGGPSPFRPAATKSPDGRLWFTNGSVVQTIDPKNLYLNRLPPPVHIEQVRTNGEIYFPDSTVRLPRLSRNIEIDYSGLSFVIPQRVQFRYELQGYDTAWQEAGVRRSAFYTNLRPGTYTFRVTASNNSAVWNTQGATLTFVILPAWYQTVWFRSLVSLLLILLGYGFYLLRTHQVEATIKARFDERLDERTRIARELHDTLLQSFHGLMFRFQAARNLMPLKPESAMHVLDEAISATEQALAEGRDAIRDLRPETSDQLDLPQLLTAVGSEVLNAATAGEPIPEFRVIAEGTPKRLSAALQSEVYRIGREVIRNAFYHAAATRIEAEVLYDELQLRMRIRDDGKGIARKDLEANGRPGHWGLPGIRERARRIGAQLDFWSEMGAGTEVELRIPAAIAYEERRARRGFRLFRSGGSGDGSA
jgi:ligand-binding sensor domain-containing protein/signal transduction histidine kinase